MHKRAKQEIQDLEDRMRERMWNTLRRLKDAVERGAVAELDIKKLKGKWGGFYRLRAGRYRLIFKMNWERQEIWIYAVVKRENAY